MADKLIYEQDFQGFPDLTTQPDQWNGYAPNKSTNLRNQDWYVETNDGVKAYGWRAFGGDVNARYEGDLFTAEAGYEYLAMHTFESTDNPHGGFLLFAEIVGTWFGYRFRQHNSVSGGFHLTGGAGNTNNNQEFYEQSDDTFIGTTVYTNVTPVPGDSTWCRMCVWDDGVSKTRFRIRCWRDGDAEPGTWDIDCYDQSTGSPRRTQGGIGIYATSVDQSGVNNITVWALDANGDRVQTGITIAPDAVTQDQALDVAVFTQQYNMQIDALSQLQSLDEATLNVGATVTPEGLMQLQTLTQAGYTQRHFYTPSALQQLQELDIATLSLEGIVQPDFIVQLQALDNATTQVRTTFSPAGLSQEQVLENVTLSFGIQINPEGLSQAQLLANTTFEQEPFITAAPLEQSQTLDNATVLLEGEVSPDVIEQAQSLSSPVLGVEIAPDALDQNQVLDVVSTQYEMIIPVDNLSQAQLLAGAGLFQRQQFMPDDLSQAQTLSTTFVYSGELYVHPDRLIFVEDEGRFVLVLKEERIIQ